MSVQSDRGAWLVRWRDRDRDRDRDGGSAASASPRSQPHARSITRAISPLSIEAPGLARDRPASTPTRRRRALAGTSRRAAATASRSPSAASRASAVYQPLAEPLIGSGLRISEALALRIGDLETKTPAA